MRLIRDRKFIWQFISYFFVGGTAALVEWISFYFFDHILSLYLVWSIIGSFITATLVNWVLGRTFTFKNAMNNRNGTKDIISVYLVSLIGLLSNFGLMYVFVTVLHFNSMLSKIMATGIVFFWNFFSRKLLVYKEVSQ